MALKKCKECGHEISTSASKCPNCGKPNRTEISGKWAALLIFVIAVGFCSVLSRNPSSPPASSVSVGNDGVLVSSGKIVPVAISEEAFEQWTKAGVANDTHGQALLLASGYVFTVNTGTKVRVIDSGIFKRRVRILSGKKVGMSGWVAMERVQ